MKKVIKAVKNQKLVAETDEDLRLTKRQRTKLLAIEKEGNK